MLPGLHRDRRPPPRSASCSSGSSPIGRPDIDQPDKSFGRPAGRLCAARDRRVVRERGQHDATAALRLMRGQFTDHNTAPIVANPDRGLAAKVVMEFRHVCHDVLDGIDVVRFRHGRAAVAAQIGSDAVPTVGGECLHLGAPHQTEGRPAMDEDHQRSVGRPARDVVR